jgi:alpha-maltose-1-phosphate synthase
MVSQDQRQHGVVMGSMGGIPEIPHIAAGLARAGLLQTYITTVTETVGGVLRLGARAPGRPGEKAQEVLARRPVPVDVPSESIVHRRATEDLLVTAVVRLTPPRLSRRVATPAYNALNRRLDRSIARALSAESAAVIGSYGACLRLFEKAGELGVPSLLHYPIAHHRYATQLLKDERQRVPEFANTMQFDTIPKRLAARYEREIDLADRILVYDTFHRRSFIEAGVPAEKLVQAPLGVDLDLFRPAPRPDDGLFRVTFVGQIAQHKGLSYLLEAFSQADISRSELLLVGRPIGDKTPWRNRDGVRHLAAVPRRQLGEIYAKTDVFVLPSLVEGFSMTPLEAMACGRPVVVSEHTFGRDLIDHGVNGFVVPIRDSAAIAELLQRLWAGSAEREEIGRAARRTAEHYSWRALGDRVASHINTLIAASPVA